MVSAQAGTRDELPAAHHPWMETNSPVVWPKRRIMWPEAFERQWMPLTIRRDNASDEVWKSRPMWVLKDTKRHGGAGVQLVPARFLKRALEARPRTTHVQEAVTRRPLPRAVPKSK